MNTKNPKKLTVSIGIPAYNEEANIGHLLSALLRQKEENYTLKEIIVVSDGSTDKTVAIARSFSDKRIKIIHDDERLSQQVRQNQILEMYASDILVLIEADTLPGDDNCIDKLIKPFIVNSCSNIGMVVGHAVSIPSNTIHGKILYAGSKIKEGIFSEWKNGKNVYSCNGQAMKALSWRFARNLSWPKDVPEDTYAYLVLKRNLLQLAKQPDAIAYMQNDTIFTDLIRRYVKFTGGIEALQEHFPDIDVKSEYKIPKAIIIKHTLKSLLLKPFLTLLYLFETTLIHLLVRKPQKFDGLSVPCLSSKKIYEY